MTRLLVGLDGSRASAAALRWAAELALATEAELLAIHACPRTNDADSTAEHEISRPALAEQWLSAAGLDAALEVELSIRQGDPREVLRAAAETDHLDLIIVGRGGDRLGVGPEHIGRVAGYTARHSPQPLAVIPVGARHRHPRIVLGVDGSEGADAAVEWCARYAPVLGASVIAVDVVEPGDRPDPSAADSDVRIRTDEAINRWTEPLASAGVAVEPVPLLHQHPSDAVLHVADSRHADMIVIGTRGAGGFDGLGVGGTAMKILRRARIPLVMVPRRTDPGNAV